LFFMFFDSVKRDWHVLDGSGRGLSCNGF
jgi:hypothetical protein